MPHNPHQGSNFDRFLKEQGILKEVEAAASKRVIAWQLSEEMARQNKTKSGFAAELGTSRSQLDRLLDPTNAAISIEVLARAAQALGKRLRIELHDIA